MYGGGARHADDKVFQFNGAGKLVRTCGNCSKQYKRAVIINTVTLTTPLKTVVGINSNYGDTAALRLVTIVGDPKKKVVPCARFKGNSSGAEPTLLGTGPDGAHCRYSDSDITYS